MKPVLGGLLRQILALWILTVCVSPGWCASKSNSDGKKSASVANPKPKSETRPSKEDAVINPETFDAGLVSRLIFELTNQERLRHGLDGFDDSAELQRPATHHSSDMAARNYFSHSTKGLFTGASFGERMKSFDITAHITAENIAMMPCVRGWMRQSGPQGTNTQVYGQTYRGLAQEAVEQWMESPGHRKNILNPELDSLGVGCAVGTHGGVAYAYLTQDFSGR